MSKAILWLREPRARCQGAGRPVASTRGPMEGRWNASRSSPARARRRAYHSRTGCHRSFLNSSGNGYEDYVLFLVARMSVHGVLTLETASEECGHRPPAFRQEREGLPRGLTRSCGPSAVPEPNEPGKASQVRSYRVLPVTQPSPEGEGPRYLTSRLFRQTLWSASRDSGQELAVPGKAARGGRVFCRGS